MATKKAYYIMDKESGKPIQIINNEKQGLTPIMSLSKTKCLILHTANEALFFDESGLHKEIVFKVEPSKAITTILL